jgi:hypothetical protein
MIAGPGLSRYRSYSELAGPEANTETVVAAERAWGVVAPDFPPPMEPWEVARGIAEMQAAVTEEAGGRAIGSPDVSGLAETW